jgi:hypothetical protein
MLRQMLCCIVILSALCLTGYIDTATAVTADKAGSGTAVSTTFEDINRALRSPGTWKGEIHLSGSDKPVQGVTLQVWGNPKGTIKTESDASGRFIVKGLPVGVDLIYEVISDDYALSQPMPDVVIPIETSVLQQDLAVEESFSIKGKVVNVHNEGIENAWVSLGCIESRKRGGKAFGYSVEAHSNKDGFFKLQGILLHADWILHIQHPNYVQIQKTMKNLSKSDDDLKIVLQAGIRISGKVLYDKSTVPASGCIVRLQNRKESELPYIVAQGVDAKGKFAFDRVAPGSYRVGALFNNDETEFEANEDVEAEEGKDVVVLLKVPQPGSLEVRVNPEPTLPPIKRLLIKAKEVHNGVEKDFDLLPNANNTFSVGSLRPRSYTFLASVEGAEPIETNPISIQSGAVQRVDLSFHKGADLSGRIMDDSTRKPIEGAQVIVYRYPEGDGVDANPGPPQGSIGVSSAVSGSDGTFVAKGLSTGKPLRIDVSHPAYAAWSSCTQYSKNPPVGEISIGLVSGANLAVELKRTDGGPIEDTYLFLKSEIPGLYNDGVSTNAQGKGSFANVPPGSYKLWFIALPPPGKEFGETFTRKLNFLPGKSMTEKIDVTGH